MKRILLIGSARHGKDTVAEMLSAMCGITFESSSMAAARIFLFDKLKDKYGYKTFGDCFEDRMNRRAEWHAEICEYNKDDKARLAKDILATSDMYVGMRSNVEVEECLRQGLFNLVIAVYDPRKRLEDATSFDINIWAKADIVIPNSGSLEDLYIRLHKIKSLFSIL
jgi:dephospho-CoA kinase